MEIAGIVIIAAVVLIFVLFVEQQIAWRKKARLKCPNSLLDFLS